MKFLYVFKACLLSITFFTKPIIHQFDVYTNKINSLYFFGDIHTGSSEKLTHLKFSNDDLAKIHHTQATDFIKSLKKVNGKNNLVIVEDIFDYDKDLSINNYFKNSYIEVIESGFSNCLTLINQICKKENISIINVEFRQPMILFFFNNEVTSSYFLKSLNETIEQIKNYNDNDFLNNYYLNSINTFLHNNKEFLAILHENSNNYIMDFIDKNDNKIKMNNFISEYLKLLDLKIIHTIFNNKQKDNIFIFAGNKHQERLTTILSSIGFNKDFHIKTKNYPLNIKQILEQTLINKIKINYANDFGYNLLFIFLIIIIASIKRINEIHILNRRKYFL